MASLPMRRSRSLLLVLILAGALSSDAFTSSPQIGGRLVQVGKQRRGAVTMMAAPPILDDWRILRSGEVKGTVTRHPTLEDGDIITTSRLTNTDIEYTDGAIVTTESGSRYKLGVRNGQAVAKKAVPAAPSKKVKSVVAKKDKSPPSKPDAAKEKAAREKELLEEKAAKERELREAMRVAKLELGVNGATVGDGRYMLAGKPQRTTSGKSQIYAAYRLDTDGLPMGPKLAVKLSPNKEALQRENVNYNRVTGGLFGGRFVNKLEFLPDAEGKGFSGQSALIVECGSKDLRALLAERGWNGLEGRAMRDAAAAMGQCVQAMHSSNMVWTDLKTENFVVVDDTLGDEGLPNVKGIDLESAVTARGNPVDYSPEACPPEFANAFLGGWADEFVLDYSYDMWSLGMMMYELSTGRPYFNRSSASQITKTLKSEDFEADVSAVEDGKLRDLIAQCLQREPRKRPNIAQFLLHPYFLTSGIGPFSF